MGEGYVELFDHPTGTSDGRILVPLVPTSVGSWSVLKDGLLLLVFNGICWQEENYWNDTSFDNAGPILVNIVLNYLTNVQLLKIHTTNRNAVKLGLLGFVPLWQLTTLADMSSSFGQVWQTVRQLKEKQKKWLLLIMKMHHSVIYSQTAELKAQMLICNHKICCDGCSEM